MPAPCRRAASLGPENHGKRRENGTDRTSATAVTPVLWASVMNASTGRLEWPMVNKSRSAAAIIAPFAALSAGGRAGP